MVVASKAVNGRPLLVIALLAAVPLVAQTPASPSPPSVATAAPPAASSTAAESPAETLSRGMQIAQAISTVTSTAMSPLLGVCILGAWEFYRTPFEKRSQLPAHLRPRFFFPIAFLLLLILGKDTLGGMTPLVKKPLDALEVLMLNKASLFLIGIPVVMHEVAQVLGQTSLLDLFAALEPVAYAQSGAAPSGLERTGTALLALLLVASGLVLTFIVWVVGHAFDVLVLLSPFPFVDILLKGMRTLACTTLAFLTILEPRLAVLVSIGVIIVCALLAGWAIRLLVFGAVFSSDLIRTIVFSDYHRPKSTEPLAGFTARPIGDIPRRAYVRVVRREDGGLELRHRAWFVGPEATVPLPAENGYDIGVGLFQPSLIETSRGGRYTTQIRLLPRYRKSEQKIASMLGVKGVRDIRFGAGLESFWGWLKDDSVSPVGLAS
ncbi:MAG: hypothetical protein JNK87_18850 [Bryobacterales bacterium]|nr:hypothetical protein [Bryobacterales bacterium]